MDPRIREQAQIIVDHSTEMQPGDNVVVAAPSVAEDLVVALFEAIGDVGANPVLAMSPLEKRTAPRASRAYLRAREEFETPAHHMALVEESDVYIVARSFENASEIGDVEPATLNAASQAQRPIQNERLEKRWCLTQFPAPGSAQLGEMSSEEYENFVWDAILKDWDAVREHQQQMVEILDPAEEVRIVSGDETDVTMSVAGMSTLNDYGKKNLPGGEVFTAPVADSVEGTVLFDMPLIHDGREIQDAFLRFEDGEVVDHSAGKNENVLTELLHTDPGARRLGELGIGMNRSIDRFTNNMLFDEKMGDTVHMAIGRAYKECGGQNESAIHVDMIVDMAEDSFIEVDGEVVQRDGTFTFEDGFEA